MARRQFGGVGEDEAQGQGLHRDIGFSRASASATASTLGRPSRRFRTGSAAGGSRATASSSTRVIRPTPAAAR